MNFRRLITVGFFISILVSNKGEYKFDTKSKTQFTTLIILCKFQIQQFSFNGFDIPIISNLLQNFKGNFGFKRKHHMSRDQMNIKGNKLVSALQAASMVDIIFF